MGDQRAIQDAQRHATARIQTQPVARALRNSDFTSFILVRVEFVVHARGDSRSRVLTMQALEKETPRRTAANVRMTAAYLREERAHAIRRIDDIEGRVKLYVRADDGH
jgi:hypothetical protein